ncbi:hypothetical protein [Pontibacillus sp. HMF3514]|uniref:hypothetical protein n=1 Tax=Pontibacillus sp. HMF3514 TaxID=2692425 RepID=UPI00131F7CD9|nr:hypothetical protein [Pontibacillus sp. HMF3514]QHE52694.1 hypothetical protein GS400_11915 [Pontibacillus sp. HMF3514]
MSYKKIFITLISMFLLALVGCSSDTVKEKEPNNDSEDIEQKIVVQKRIGEDNNYKDLQEILNSEGVAKVKDIVNNIKWKM